MYFLCQTGYLTRLLCSLVRYPGTSTFEINFIFPHIHVLLSIVKNLFLNMFYLKLYVKFCKVPVSSSSTYMYMQEAAMFKAIFWENLR